MSNIPQASEEIAAFMNSHLWSRPDIEIAEFVFRTASKLNSVEFFAFNCLHSIESYLRFLFPYGCFLWKDWSTVELCRLTLLIRERPKPFWAYPGGEYSDVKFYAKTLELNPVEISRIATADKTDQENIAAYFRLNANVLVEYIDSYATEGPDTFDTVLKRCKAKVRNRVLSDHPRIDISGWSVQMISDCHGEN